MDIFVCLLFFRSLAAWVARSVAPSLGNTCYFLFLDFYLSGSAMKFRKYALFCSVTALLSAPVFLFSYVDVSHHSSWSRLWKKNEFAVKTKGNFSLSSGLLVCCPYTVLLFVCISFLQHIAFGINCRRKAAKLDLVKKANN